MEMVCKETQFQLQFCLGLAKRSNPTSYGFLSIATQFTSPTMEWYLGDDVPGLLLSLTRCLTKALLELGWWPIYHRDCCHLGFWIDDDPSVLCTDKIKSHVKAYGQSSILKAFCKQSGTQYAYFDIVPSESRIPANILLHKLHSSIGLSWTCIALQGSEGTTVLNSP